MRIPMIVILGSMLCARAAGAQEISTAHAGAGEWSESWIDRPLVLAPRMVQANLGVDVTNAAIGSGNATGESMSAAFDIGIVPRVQAGIALTFPVNPAAFGSALADVQFGLSDQANLRFDAGVARGGFTGGPLESMANIYEFGLGVPIKVKLAQGVAFISGRTSAAGFARPLALAGDGGGLAFGASPFFMSESLFAVGINDNGVASYTANAPVGLLIAPHERVAIALHTGYRYAHSGSQSGSGRDLNFVPFGGDLMFNLPSHVDLGVSGDVAGPVDSNDDYLSYRQFMAWLQARF